MKLNKMPMSAFLMILSVAVMLAGCSKLGGDVSLVKNGSLVFDKSITVGQAFDNYKYFNSKEWRAYKTDQGRRCVEFTGTCNMSNPDIVNLDVHGYNRYNAITVIVKFLINTDNTFEAIESTTISTKGNGKIVEDSFHTRNDIKTLRDIGYDRNYDMVIRPIYQNNLLGHYNMLGFYAYE